MNERIAARYRVERPLGEGAFGAVLAARDELSGEPVAVKLIPVSDDHDAARVRREISALRLLDDPGVVRLRDDGVDDGRYFLVMDMVEGRPFPGLPTPARWDALAPVARRLIATLARIHAVGIMHRDLKPANVLVSADGQPTLVDFGVSGGPCMGRAITARGTWLGTPAYFAPEVIAGQVVDFRADLYAVGLMLYEALTGALPHGDDTLQDLVVRRLAGPPTPARELDPTVPAGVSGMITRLLASAPAARPSAQQALAMLRADGADSEAAAFPRLGGDAPVRTALSLLRRRRSVAVVGPTGSGRARVITEALGALTAEGSDVVWLPRGSRPWESLAPLLPAAALTGAASDVERIATEAVSRALATGFLGVRREGLIDRWTLGLLERLRDHGPIASPISALAADQVALQPLTRAALEPLFAGPDRLLHLVEDGAAELFARTGGLATAVVEEVTAWVQGGLATWTDDRRLRVTRAALDRLHGDLRPMSSWQRWSGGGGALGPDDREQAELCKWLAAAGGRGDPTVLSRAMGRADWEVDTVLADLAGRGVIERRTDGTVALTARITMSPTWSVTRQRHNHAALADALPPGSRERAGQLLAAGALSDGAVEAAAVAEARLEAGQLGRSLAAIDAGLVAARGADDAAAEARLLTLLVRAACGEASASRLDQALYETGRASSRTPAVEALERLARGACNVCRTVGAAPLEALGAVAPFDDPELERWRHAYRVRASRAVPEEVAEAALAEAAAWAERVGTPRARALLLTWRGLHAYRLTRYDAAERCQSEASASGALDGGTALGALIDLASAALEAGHLGRAREVADEAVSRAAALRLPMLEARVTWLSRLCRYRAEEALSCDEALVEAASHLGRSSLEGVIAMLEATLAWRAAADVTAHRLASQAASAFQRSNARFPAALAEALACRASGSCDRETAARLRAAAEACPEPGIALQIRALTPAAAWPDRAALARSLWEQLPSSRREGRLDVLSAPECLALLGVA